MFCRLSYYKAAFFKNKIWALRFTGTGPAVRKKFWKRSQRGERVCDWHYALMLFTRCASRIARKAGWAGDRNDFSNMFWDRG